MKAIRHGDLCSVQITEMPNDIEPVKTKTIMQDAHGNNHDVKRRIIYLEDVIACASSSKTCYWERCYC
jgi:hypothetical protein